ncbi:transcription termination factor Rho [Dubosiella muris]|mgnify:CR=1 FL=1|uniref:transcription termination factor Rho n=1 Tax=Dubosiella muris TaxID=3038133 RepID=UPI00240EB097|nr:transcription termination factor Rho [Dubosiella muris]
MIQIEGILETFHQGFGFIRTERDGDVFVDSAFISAYDLKNNDFIIGEAEKDREGRSEFILKKITSVNRIHVEEIDIAKVQRELQEKKNRERAGASGILEVMEKGFGFLRQENYLSGDDDVYVSESKIKALKLRTGDSIEGVASPKHGQSARALESVDKVNGHTIKECLSRKRFDQLTPIFPNRKLKMETVKANYAGRIVDLFAPIGCGQRGMIVAPPKAGKTTLLEMFAQSILKNHKDVYLIVLLIDERPEEVTAFKEMVIEAAGENKDHVEVVYSTFDEQPMHHKRVAEMALARAKSLVEFGEDVVILLDSITRLSRAYNLIVPSTGKVLSGGLDPNALYGPKRLFGAARNLREGGSLTVIASALVETGSRMDEMIFEEFKGTGNMELYLDRTLAERRVYPAINIQRSSTRHDDLLLSKEAYDIEELIRREWFGSNNTIEDTLTVLKAMSTTRSNSVLCKALLESKKKA